MKNVSSNDVEPKDKTKDRRTILKSIVAGSAVVSGNKVIPEQWSKPLTDSVILPSHAQTTGDWNQGDYGTSIQDGYLNTENPSDPNAPIPDDAPTGDYTFGDNNGDYNDPGFDPDDGGATDGL